MKYHLTDRTDALKTVMLRMMLQALDCAPGEVWLITPWIKDVKFSLAAMGGYKSLLGGERDSVSLREVLRMLADKHLLNVVVKPPHELVDLTRLSALTTGTARQGVLQADEDIDLDLKFELLQELGMHLSALKRELLTHADTVLFADELSRLGARVFYREALHAKLLWMPNGALFGSANFTNGGLSFNAELVAEVRETEPLEGLRAAALQLQHASWPQERYDLGDADQIPYRARLRKEEFWTLTTHAPFDRDPEYQQILDAMGRFYL